jgi:ketosteroid isomerase-like protein
VATAGLTALASGRTGRPWILEGMSQENLQVVTFRAGKVLRYQEFYDQQDALAALEG